MAVVVNGALTPPRSALAPRQVDSTFMTVARMHCLEDSKMRRSGLVFGLAVAGIGLACPVVLLAQGGADGPLGNGFSYQGRVEKAGVPIHGKTDMIFRLYDAAVLKGTETFSGASAVDVDKGLFTVVLDYGSAPINGNALDLEIAVRFPSGVGGYTTLSPRQPLNPGPYSIYAKKAPWSGVIGAPSCLPVCLPFSGSVNSATPAFAVKNNNVTTGAAYALKGVRGSDYAWPGNLPSVYAASADSTIGLYASGKTWGVVGSVNKENATGVLGNISTDGSANSTAVDARNDLAKTRALLGTENYAADLRGNGLISGMLMKRYTSTTYNHGLPIAYGYINSNGTVANATPNVSVSWDTTYDRYLVTIAGEAYWFNDYVTVIQVGGTSPRVVTNGSTGGKMTVYITNLSGTKVQNIFQFVTFKPTGSEDGGYIPPTPPGYMDDVDWYMDQGIFDVMEPTPSIEEPEQDRPSPDSPDEKLN